jgi:hypothetical protein
VRALRRRAFTLKGFCSDPGTLRPIVTRAFGTGARVGDRYMVVEEQTLLSSVVLPETYPGSVLLEAFVGAVTLADVADFVRNRADEGVDVGVVGGGIF